MLVFAALAAVMVIARKLGPAAVSGPEGYWRLGLPLERRPMVAGLLVRRLLLVWAGASVLYLPFGFVMDRETNVRGQVLTAATFGVGAVCAVLLAGLQQAPPAPQSAAERRRGLLPGLLVLAHLSLVTLRVAAVFWTLAVGALCVTGALGLLVFARLDRIPGRELIRGGAVSGHTGAAVYLMDLNEIGRALWRSPTASPPPVCRAGMRGAGGHRLVPCCVLIPRRSCEPAPYESVRCWSCCWSAVHSPAGAVGDDCGGRVCGGTGAGAVARRTAIMPGHRGSR